MGMKQAVHAQVHPSGPACIGEILLLHRRELSTEPGFCALNLIGVCQHARRAVNRHPRARFRLRGNSAALQFERVQRCIQGSGADLIGAVRAAVRLAWFARRACFQQVPDEQRITVPWTRGVGDPDQVPVGGLPTVFPDGVRHALRLDGAGQRAKAIFWGARTRLIGKRPGPSQLRVVVSSCRGVFWC